MSINVEWALESKLKNKPGYSVLAASKGISSDEFRSFINQLAVGNMPERDGIDAGAPWITFATLEKENTKFFCIVQEDWLQQDYRDGSSRSVSAICCLAIHENDLLSTKLLLSDIQQLLNKLDILSIITRVNSEGLNFENDPLTVEPISDTHGVMLKEEEFTIYAKLASGIISNPIALIIRSDQLPWQERLEWLDKTLALLPYPVRFSIPASIWAQSTTLHKMRLNFSSNSRRNTPDKAQDQVKAILKQDTLELELTSSDSRDYYELLLEYKNKYGIPKLLEHLRNATETIDISEPQKIIKYLSSLNGSLAAYIRMRARSEWRDEDRKKACELLDSSPADALTSAQKLDLLKRLLPGLRDEEIPIVQKHWQGELLDPTLGYARDALNGGAPSRPFLERLYRLLGGVGHARDFFTTLLETLKPYEETSAKISKWKPEQQQKLNQIIFLIQSASEQESEQSLSWLNEIPLKEVYLYWWAWLIVNKKTSEMREKSAEPLRKFLRGRTGINLQALHTVWLVGDTLERDEFEAAVNLDAEFIAYSLVLASLSYAKTGKVLKAFSEWFLSFNLEARNSDYWLNLFDKAANAEGLSGNTHAEIDILRLAIISPDKNVLKLLLDRYIESATDFKPYLDEFLRLFEISANKKNILTNITAYCRKFSGPLKYGTSANNCNILKNEINNRINIINNRTRNVDESDTSDVQQQVSLVAANDPKKSSPRSITPEQLVQSYMDFISESTGDEIIKKAKEISQQIFEFQISPVVFLDTLNSKVDFEDYLLMAMVIDQFMLSEDNVSFYNQISDYRKDFFNRINAQLKYIAAIAPLIRTITLGKEEARNVNAQIMDLPNKLLGSERSNVFDFHFNKNIKP